MKFSNFNSEAKRTSYRHGNLFEEGSYVHYQDKVGKVHRRGPNYFIAITCLKSSGKINYFHIL